MTNPNDNISSISLYARPSESFLFSLIDENNNQLSSELINMINSRMTTEDDPNLNTMNTPHNIPHNTSEWSIHNPETRTIFQELRMKLRDIEAVYKTRDSNVTTEHSVIPTTETIENVKKLEECIEFFKEKINIYFNKFVDSNLQCEREEAFLSQCSSLLDVMENPSIEEQDFNQCAISICQSLETFTSQINNKISQNRKNREIYWSQYKQFRDNCKLIKEVQSDIVCQICMEREVNMALNCGHCFCTECATRSNSCPNCRTPASRKLKLFF